MSGPIEVAVIGSCMIDMICYTPRIPRPGETLHGTSFEFGNGGKGANQCVAAANMGASTALIAVLGNDSFGTDYRQHLMSCGVNIDRVRLSKDKHSGMAQITVTESGENSIVIVAGANTLLNFQQVQQGIDEYDEVKVAVFQLESPIETTLEAMKYLKSRGNCKTILNAAPAVADLPEEMFGLSDVLCVNETEASQLCGWEVGDVESACRAVGNLTGRGCRLVVVTMGPAGVVYGTAATPPIHLLARKVNPVDTTGAGDAFVGALAFYLARHPNLPLRVQLERAAHIATESVLRRGTQSSYPKRDELPDELFQ